MTASTDVPLAAPAALYRFLYRTLSLVRWSTLAIVLLLTLVHPHDGRTALPTWLLVLGFITYNLLAGLLLQGRSKLRFAYPLYLIFSGASAMLRERAAVLHQRCVHSPLSGTWISTSVPGSPHP